MLKRWKWIIMAVCLIACFLLQGCDSVVNEGVTNDDLASADYFIYYTNQSKTELIPQPCEFTSDEGDTEAMIDEMMEMIQVDPASVEIWKVLPETVVVSSYSFDLGILDIDFNDVYNDMKSEQEILCRGAISKDFLQIPGINGVRFTVMGEPLLDASGDRIGLVTSDSFLMDTAVDQDDLQETDLVLYFASKDGQSLVREVQTARYPASMSIEKVIMRRLLAGPLTETPVPSLPASTNLISISVMDGVCFVNLDENFLVQDFNVSEKIVIYSIVDSLTALDSVDMVQISVNGETNLTYRNSISLSEQFTQDLEYVIN